MPRSGSSSSPYAAAANLLSQIITERKSFKHLVYAKNGTLKCNKATYAQVCHTLSYHKILEQILNKVPSLSNDIHNTGLLHVLVYELLFGPNQSIRGGGAVKRKILQHEADLRKAIKDKDIAQKIQECQAQSQQQDRFPRYARVNTLCISLDEVCQALLSQAKSSSEDKEDGLEFYIDPHVPNLLVLPPSIVTETMSASAEDTTPADSNNHNTNKESSAILCGKWIKSGKLILQDKSSCFSAYCMVHGMEQQTDNHQKYPDYLDACAAPGNKTQHLAAQLGAMQMSNTKNSTSTAPTVYALDRDKERLASLQRRMQQLVPSNHSSGVKVDAKECDFLQTKPEDFATVGAILLDPSCSGSGIMTAPDRWTEVPSSSEHSMDAEGQKRVESLAKFQEKALCHAMSFPSVSRIVYSTCSVHERENEQVVVNALNQEGNSDAWEIIAPTCLQQWKRRGHAIEGLAEEKAKCMIRADGTEDETNGFFVCCLQRRTNEGSKESTAVSVALSSMVETPKGTSLYKGQLANKGKKIISKKESPMAIVDSTAGSPSKKPDQQQERSKSKTDISATKKSKKKESKKDKEDTTVKKKLEKAEVPEDIPKKVAKRLAWKKRQMEEKQNRLKKAKKSKTANIEK